jgi:hypothetical protein
VVFFLLCVGSMLALLFKVRLLGVVGVGADFLVVLLVQLQVECLDGRLVPPLKPNMAERLCDYCGILCNTSEKLNSEKSFIGDVIPCVIFCRSEDDLMFWNAAITGLVAWYFCVWREVYMMTSSIEV